MKKIKKSETREKKTNLKKIEKNSNKNLNLIKLKIKSWKIFYSKSRILEMANEPLRGSKGSALQALQKRK